MIYKLTIIEKQKIKIDKNQVHFDFCFLTSFLI